MLVFDHRIRGYRSKHCQEESCQWQATLDILRQMSGRQINPNLPSIMTAPSFLAQSGYQWQLLLDVEGLSITTEALWKCSQMEMAGQLAGLKDLESAWILVALKFCL